MTPFRTKAVRKVFVEAEVASLMLDLRQDEKLPRPVERSEKRTLERLELLRGRKEVKRG
jgi:hypothetical protein